MIKIGGSKSTGTALLAYPGYAYPNESHYLVHVSGMAWRTPVVFNRRQKVMIRMLGGVMHASPDDLSSDIFQERITPFMAAARKRKSVIITINGVNYRLTKKTRGTGQFFGWVNVPRQHLDLAFQNGETCIPYRVSFDDELVEPAEGVVHIYERVGTSVVSDIDDTIKDSLVADRRALLTNTFLREFRSIEGMARVYNEWSDRGASFHYVSSSPWQLFESLDEMTDRCGFPRGTMHLRNFRLRDQFLKKFLIRRKGKATAIRTLMKKMPGRNFVLVGDSGERDAKIYRKVCDKYPGRIKGVFIRNVAESPLKKSHFEKLKKSLPNGVCCCFSDAEELAEKSRLLF